MIQPARGGRGHYVLFGLLVLSGCAALWLALAASFTRILEDDDPWRALDWTLDSYSLGNAAETALAASASSSVVNDADKAARLSLAEDVTDPVAYEVLAKVAAKGGDAAAAEQRYRLASSVSLRQIDVDVWLGTLAFRRGDMNAALRYMGTAMTLSPDVRATTTPALAGALGDDRVFAALSDAMRRAPIWANTFFHLAPANATSAHRLGELFVIAQRAHAPITTGVEEDFVAWLLQHGEVGLASRLYSQDNGIRVAAGLRDGGFEAPLAPPPFGWSFSNSPNDHATPDRLRGGQEASLWFHSEGFGAAPLARQLVLLAPGVYQFTARVRLDSLERGSPPLWTIRCANDPAALGSAKPAPDANGQWQTTAFSFTVPPSACPGLWVELETAEQGGAGVAEGFTDTLTIVRR